MQTSTSARTGSGTSRHGSWSRSGSRCGNGQCAGGDGLKLFDTVKEVRGLLASTYAEDDKARLSVDLVGAHEEHGVNLKAIWNMTGALETHKNKTLVAAMLYRLVRLSNLHGELPPGERVP